MDAQETVGKDSAAEKRAELTFDEARDRSLFRARVFEPGFQLMLDHPKEGSRLRTARRLFEIFSRLTVFAHEAMVVS